MTFLFGVLGSVAFWVSFFAVGLFIGSLLMKHFAPKTFHFVSTGERSSSYDVPGEYVIIAFTYLIFWPVILFGAVVGLIFSKIFWPLLCKAIKTSISLVPDIEIKNKKEEGKE